MKRFSLVCCLILMLNMFCPAAHVHAEGITTPTDLPCSHTYIDVSIDSYKHCIKCESCGQVFGEENHFAICSDKTRCMTCGETNLVEPYVEHSEWKIIKSDANGHQYGCASCGETSSVEDHYAWCNLTECEECGYSLTGLIYRVDHNPVSYPGEVVNDKYGHKYYCGYCGELWNETAHLVACDAADLEHCQTCGMSSSEVNLGIDHGRNEELKHDENEHWTVCMRCEEEYDRIKHSVSCVSATQDKCDFCGQSGVNCVSRHNSLQISHNTTSHLSTCKHCGEIFDCLINESDSIQSSGGMSAAVIVKQPTHTEDGLKRGHCYACSNKIVEIPIKAEGHTWSKQTETPATCTTEGEVVYSCSGCDELRTETIPIRDHTMEWQWDALGHWQECVYCGQEDEHWDHSRQCTATACESCGYDGGQYMNVNHNFGETYVYNEYYHQTTCADCGYKETSKHWHPDDSYDVCVACGAQFENEHSHTMGESGYETAENGHWFTCTTCGVATAPVAHSYTCKGLCLFCGYEGSNNLAVSHTWSGMLNAGDYHYMICSDCGIRISSQIHWVSCDKPGVCLDCGATDVTNSNVLHSLTDEYEYDATKHWQECVKCGAKDYEGEHVADCTLPGVCYTCYAEIDGIKIDGHNYADCEIYHNETDHWQLCQRCGATEKNPHREFCTDVNGYCDVCGFADDFDITHIGYIIPAWEADATNHWQICATCEKAANAEAHVDKDADEKCDVCGMSLAHVHAWGEPVIVEATCTTDGNKTITCAICCGETIENIKATGHVWGEPVTVEATCAVDGSITTACANCGEKTEEVIPANDNHSWKTVVNVAATCTKKGRTEKICTVCDETSIVTYAAKGHHEVVDEAKEATSKEDGLTEGKHCDVCGAVIVAQEVIPAVKRESIPMTELEILVNHVTAESQHDNRGGNIPQNGKDFEIPLTKSDKTSKGVVLQVYRDDNETYNAVGLSTTFKKDVTAEIDTWKEKQSVEALQNNNQAIADFGDYFRSLIQVLNPECTVEESEELLLDVLKSISITDENIEEVMSAFINGELADDLRTVIKDGYEYLLVFDGETLSLSVRKIAD